MHQFYFAFTFTSGLLWFVEMPVYYVIQREYNTPGNSILICWMICGTIHLGKVSNNSPKHSAQRQKYIRPCNLGTCLDWEYMDSELKTFLFIHIISTQSQRTVLFRSSGMDRMQNSKKVFMWGGLLWFKEKLQGPDLRLSRIYGLDNKQP